MKDNHDEDAEISVSLETLARHISGTSRNELAALRAAFDQHICSIEARLEASNHQPAVDASESADNKGATKISQLSTATTSKSTPQTIPAAASPVSAPKTPLQFSERARDAKRVKVRRSTSVSVDGIPGELVDLSVGGAQAVLRHLVKPNQLVRLVCPTAAGQLACKGRIVWVVYEQPGTSLSVYRMGVKFTDVDAKAVEDFMKDFCEEPVMPSQQSSGIA